MTPHSAHPVDPGGAQINARIHEGGGGAAPRACPGRERSENREDPALRKKTIRGLFAQKTQIFLDSKRFERENTKITCNNFGWPHSAQIMPSAPLTF